MFGCNENTRSPSPSGQDTSLETKDTKLFQSLRKRSSSEALNKSVGESPSKRRLSSFRESSDSDDSGPNRHDSDEMEELDLSKISFVEEKLVIAEASSATGITDQFSIGSYIVLKHDFHTRNTYPIWRIEERSLQRFIPIIKQGKKLFKSTNQYQVWDIIQKDQYYSIPVTYVSECQTEIIVELELGLIKASIC